MKKIGIVISKNILYYSVVSGENKATATINDAGQKNFQIDSNELMMDFERIFEELITKHNPNEICYKISEKLKLEQFPYMYYPFGVLNLICEKKKIKTRVHSMSWISKKVKGKKKMDSFVEKFSDFSKKEELKQSALIAWYDLGD